MLLLGTRVRMSKAGCREYHDDHSNPHAGFGVVVDLRPDDDHYYGVDWDNGAWNCYRRDEIERVGPPPSETDYKEII